MKISKLYIHGFGRLKDIELNLSDGFNVLFGPNEQGKSTIMAFIRAVLYGFPSGGRQIESNERKHYQPWDGRRMGGYIVFEHQEIRYRLERWFGKSRAVDQLKLMHDISGNTISLSNQEEPGNKILQLSENEFVNTVFVRQLESQISQSDTLINRLNNLTATGDEADVMLEQVVAA